MPAATFSMTIERGATLSHPVTVKDKTTGNPIDLTGATITAKYRPKVGGTLADLTITPTSLATGQFSIGLTAAQTDVLQSSVLYAYDVKVVLVDTTIVYYLKGDLKILDVITD